MSSVNTTSEREGIARMEQDLTRLGEQGKLSDENRGQFRSLRMIVNKLMAVFMENYTENQNSIVADGGDKSATTSGRNGKRLTQN